MLLHNNVYGIILYNKNNNIVKNQSKVWKRHSSYSEFVSRVVKGWSSVK